MKAMGRRSASTETLLPLDEPALPTDFFERRARKRGAEWIAGVDEAGRGPLAGPVVVAAVMFEGRRFPRGLDDSKKLTLEERLRLYDKILASGFVGIAVASRARIDSMNILQASLWGMTKAVRALPRRADHVLVDGNMLPRGLPCPGEALVSGDSRSVSIAAASIVAKVTRDRMMVKLSRRYRRYAWDSNKGYGTREHAEAIKKHGVCTHHRRSFSPIERALRLLDAGAEPPLPEIISEIS